MTGFARTPVVPEAAPVGALSAQLRRPRSRSATSAIRRLRSSLRADSDRIGDAKEGPVSAPSENFPLFEVRWASVKGLQMDPYVRIAKAARATTWWNSGGRLKRGRTSYHSCRRLEFE